MMTTDPITLPPNNGEILERLKQFLQSLSKVEGTLEIHQVTLYGSERPRVRGIVDQVNDLRTEFTTAINELREETTKLRKSVEDINQAKKQEQRLMLGIAIGLGATALTGAGTLAAVLRVLATGGP